MSTKDDCFPFLNPLERGSWSEPSSRSIEGGWARKSRRDKGDYVLAHIEKGASQHPASQEGSFASLKVGISLARRLAAFEREQKRIKFRQLLNSRQIQELEAAVRACEKLCRPFNSEEKQAIINATTHSLGRLSELTSLKSGWDSESAPAPSELAMNWARVAIGSLSSLGQVTLSLNPMRDGGIGIELAQAKGQMFLDIYNDGTAVIVQCNDSEVLSSSEFEASELPVQLREIVFS